MKTQTKKTSFVATKSSNTMCSKDQNSKECPLVIEAGLITLAVMITSFAALIFIVETSI